MRAFAGHLLEWYGSDNLLSYLSAINFYYQNQGYAKPWTGGRCRRLCNAYTTAREARARANGEKGGGLRVQPDGVIRQHAKAEGVSINLCRLASSAHDQITDWFSPPPAGKGENLLSESIAGLREGGFHSSHSGRRTGASGAANSGTAFQGRHQSARRMEVHGISRTLLQRVLQGPTVWGDQATIRLPQEERILDLGSELVSGR